MMRHDMKRIQSKLRKIWNYDVYKISLSCFDEKRYILDDGINNLAYFHKDVKFNRIGNSVKSLKLIKSSQINKKLCLWSKFLGIFY